MKNKAKLIDILTDYFGINESEGSYAYNLVRVKEAFDVGTMTFDDFQEFDQDTIDDIAEYIIGKYGDEL